MATSPIPVSVEIIIAAAMASTSASTLRAPSPKAASVNNGHSAFCTTCDATPRLRPASTLPATTIKVCGTTAAAESANGHASSGCLKT